jgi:hypothetical protein
MDGDVARCQVLRGIIAREAGSTAEARRLVEDGSEALALAVQGDGKIVAVGAGMPPSEASPKLDAHRGRCSPRRSCSFPASARGWAWPGLADLWGLTPSALLGYI